MKIKSSNLVAVEHRVSPEHRCEINGHKGAVLWLTGLPGSGKTTLAVELEHQLFLSRRQVYVLDGDNIRQGLSSDLGFAPSDRSENIRRIGEVAGLFADAGFIVIAAFISPYKIDRTNLRRKLGNYYNEIYIKADVKTCEERDPKGHYKLARNGRIKGFTGISAPYEVPRDPELVIDTKTKSIEKCIAKLTQYVDANFVNRRI